MQSGKSHQSSSVLYSRDFETRSLRKYATFPLRAIKTTAPGIAPLSTSVWKASVTRFNCSEEKPTSSGWLALGRPCASAENATHVATADMQMMRRNRIDASPYALTLCPAQYVIEGSS